MSFGFSAGDFATALKVAWEIQEAFRDSSGSVEQYRTIMETVGTYGEIIFTCQQLSSQWISDLTQASRSIFGGTGIANISRNDQALINGISHILNLSQDAMNSFLKRNKKYTESFIKSRASHSMAKQWLKVKFVFRRSEVDKLENDLREYVRSLQFYTLTLAMRATAINNSKQEATNTTTATTIKNIDSNIHQIQNLLLYLQKDFSGLMKIVQDLPNMLGYPWATAGFSSNDKPIILEDALGRTVKLPFLLCTTRSQFQSLMLVLFDDLPGYTEISRGDFTLQNKDGRILKGQNWDGDPMPGSHLLMSVIIRQDYCSRDWEPWYSCGKCGFWGIELNSNQCPRCLQHFQLIRQKREIPLRSQRNQRFEKRQVESCNKISKTIKGVERWCKNLNHDAPERTLHRVTFIQERTVLPLNIEYYRLRRRLGERLSATHIAVLSGDLEELRRVVGLHRNSETELLNEIQYDALFPTKSVLLGDRPIFKTSPLHLAAEKARLDMLVVLLDAGFDVDALGFLDIYPDTDLYTPLTICIEKGYDDCVQFLVDYGANCGMAKVVAIVPKYLSPLEHAVKVGNLKICKLLLDHGATAYGKLQEIYSPMRHALISGRDDILNLLIHAGAEREVLQPS